MVVLLGGMGRVVWVLVLLVLVMMFVGLVWLAWGWEGGKCEDLAVDVVGREGEMEVGRYWVVEVREVVCLVRVVGSVRVVVVMGLLLILDGGV